MRNGTRLKHRTARSELHDLSGKLTDLLVLLASAVDFLPDEGAAKAVVEEHCRAFASIFGLVWQRYPKLGPLLRYGSAFSAANAKISANSTGDSIVRIGKISAPSWHHAVMADVERVIDEALGWLGTDAKIGNRKAQRDRLAKTVFDNRRYSPDFRFLGGRDYEEVIARLSLECAVAETLVSEVHVEKPNRSPEFGAARRRLTVRDKRDKWIYEKLLDLANKGPQVLQELQRLCRLQDWPNTISTPQGLFQAAERYIERNQKPPLPARKDSTK